jgi:hypothetical protein
LLKPASGGVCAVLWTCIEGDDSARRGSVYRIDHGLKHRQAAGRQSNASPDHNTVVSLGSERPLYLGSGCFIGLYQAQVRAPSAFGHTLRAKAMPAWIFSAFMLAEYGVRKIHGLWLLPYEGTRVIDHPSRPPPRGHSLLRGTYRAVAPLST